MNLLCSDVGDRNVLELMQEKQMVLGGEQSGHIIFLDHMTTGDGQLAALQFLQILSQSGQTASQLASAFTRYPQILLNVKAPHENEKKKALLNSDALKDIISQSEKALHGDGRILVRASGTEALIRVMVEASDEMLARSLAERLAVAVENLQK